MIISTKGRYALRVMTDLAQHQGEGIVPLKAIAERQEVSLKYLEAIVASLTRAGVLISQRGKDGGYRLARQPAAYTVWEIVCLSEGNVSPVACLECTDSHCEKADSCLTLPVWQQLDGLIESYLSGITIADLVTGAAPTAQLVWEARP